MRIAHCFGALAMAAMLSSAGGAAAATLLVNNGDFNDGPAKGDGQHYAGDVLPGWKGSSATAHWDPGNFHFFDEATHGGVALIYPGAGLKTLTQVVAGHTIQANTRYTLTVDVGLYNGASSFMYDFGLIAGDLVDGLVVAELIGDGGSAGGFRPGLFKTLTLSFVTGADDDIIGKQLMIGLGSAAHGVSYDNVQLDAVSLASGVPEPATWAMLISGFAAAGVMVRRRRTPALA